MKKKRIYHDCRKAMLSCAAIYGLSAGISALIGIRMAGILGEFADAVFNLDLTFGLQNIGRLLGCIAIQIVIVPLVGLFGEKLQFARALLHERMVFGRFMNKEYRKIAGISQGEVLYRMDNDVNDFRCVWTIITEKYFCVPVTAVFLIISAVRISWLYAVIAFAVSMIKLSVPAAVKKLEALYDRQTRDYLTTVRSCEADICRSPHTVRLFGLQEALAARLDRQFQMYARTVLQKSIVCKTLADRIGGRLGTCCTLVILLSGAVLTARESITPGAVAAMMGYVSVFYLVADHIGTVIRQRPILKNLSERMLFFYDDETETRAGVTVEEMTDMAAEELAFSYDTFGAQPNVFEHLSFRLETGRKIAVCGANGKGKSTLIKLICGLLKPYEGTLKINGTELSRISPENWQQQIAYVEQEPYLFAGTVEENVRLGRPAASREETRRVMEEVEILPLADRKIVSGKECLSGGEKQRVAIARAVLKGAPFLILDEPGNHLDEECLAWLETFIREFPGTILFVSHQERLSAAADIRINL